MADKTTIEGGRGTGRETKGPREERDRERERKGQWWEGEYRIVGLAGRGEDKESDINAMANIR